MKKLLNAFSVRFLTGIAGLIVSIFIIMPESHAALKHRWGFDENGGTGTTLGDMVSGANATLEEIGGNNADVGQTYAGQVYLAGGAKDSSDYVKLPVGVISAMTDDATIELWATQCSIQNWSRIWDFGVDVNDRFNITWTRGTTLTQDEIVWTDTGVVAGDNNNGVNDSLAPYTLGQEFHIVFVIDVEATGPGTKTVVKWYKDGVYRGTLDTFNKLSNLGDTGLNTLGRSRFGDNTANASFKEFRIYDHAMTAAEVADSFIAGPDSVPARADLPSDVTINSATLNGYVSVTNGLTAVWFFMGLTDEGTNMSAWATNYYMGQRSIGPISTNLTGLLPDTLYYYRVYVSNAVWQAMSPVVSFAPLGPFSWDGDANDFWGETNNWAGFNIPNQASEWAKFSVAGIGDVDLNEESFTIGYTVFAAGGYNIVDRYETPGTLTMGSLTNLTGENIISVGMTVTGRVEASDGNLVFTKPGSLNAGEIRMAGGNVELQGPLNLTYGRLNHWGYNFNNDTQNNLDGNGGLLTNTPYAKVFLMAGPAGRGLNFDTDADFINAGAVSIWDNYMNLFYGYFVAQESGNHEFKINNEDDIGSIWFDKNRNGIFEAPGGYRTGENLAWEDWGTKTVSLQAGGIYKFAVTHREGGGGSGIDVSFKAPSMGAHATIKPSDQSPYWAIGDYGSFSAPTVPVTAISNAALKVSGTSAELGKLSVLNGASLAIEGSGTDLSFSSIVVTGGLAVTGCNIDLTNLTYGASSIFTINSGASAIFHSPLTVDSLLAYGAFSAPGTITASTKMSFDPTLTITNVLAGAAAVYYGESRALNGIITPTEVNTYTGGTWIRRAILRAASGTGLPTAGCLRFWSGDGNGQDALLETSGAVTNWIGTGSGQVYWEGSGGFSAYGGPLTVNLEGGTTLTFGDANTGFRGQYLQLNSDNSDNVLELKNNINLTTGSANIYVRDNTASSADMVIFSGVISGTTNNQYIYRRGKGLTWLTATNTFQQRIFFEDCGPIRADPGVGMPNNVFIRYDTGGWGDPGVWEAKGVINRNLAAEGTVGAIYFQNGHGGFSAYGGKLTVTLNGAGSTIDWSANPTGFNNKWLQLCSPWADNEIEITNPMDLKTGERNIVVFDNAATNTDVGVLSGNIIGSDASQYFRKFRPGVLWLKGTNTFSQRILLDEGVIRGDSGIGISPNSSFRFDQGSWSEPGVWETSGTITNDINNDGVPGSLRWNENGGFAAYGGPLTVNLKGGATLDAGSSTNGFNGRQLHLGSRTANDVVDLRNNIWMQNRTFQIYTFDNPWTTNDYVIYSGQLSYTGWGVLELRGEALIRLPTTNAISAVRLYNSAKVMFNGFMNGNEYLYTELNQTPTVGGNGTLLMNYYVDIRTGGILAPGDNGIGTLNVTVNGTGATRSFEMWSGSTYECELGGNAYDHLALSGDLILDDGWILKLIDVGIAPKTSDRFDIISYTRELTSSASEGSNLTSVVVDCSALPSHFVTNSIKVIHDIDNKLIYFTGLSSTLSVGNEEASSLTDVSAQLNGILSCSGETFDVYAYWGLVDGGATTNWANTAYVGQYSDVLEQSLSTPAGSLTGNTEYYYTFRASNTTYDIWAGASESFKTLGIPVVTNGSGASSVKAGSARLNGAFVDHNRGDVTICWGLVDQGTNNMFAWDHATVLGAQSAESFMAVVTEVFYPLTYYYRCFATNDYGYGWSAAASSFVISGKPGNYAPPDGLLGRWTFNDNTCNDSSGNDYHGVNVGGGYDADVPAALAGGKSINQTAGNYYVKVDTGGNQDVFDLQEFSVSVWHRGWPGDWRPFVSKKGDNGQGWMLRRYGNTANVAWTLRGVSDDNWSIAATVNDGNWHHLVASYMNGQSRLYIDGVRVADVVRTGYVNGSSDMLTFGARNYEGVFDSHAFVKLDDINIYNRVINSNEVTWLYNNTLVPLVGITNEMVSDVTGTSAQFNATLEGSNAAYQVFGYWGELDGGTNTGGWSNSVNLGWYTNFTGDISFITNGINPGTTNWYTFRATNGSDNIWAVPSLSFQPAVMPVVDNGSGAVTTGVGVVTLNGILSAGNYAHIYVYWGTADGVENTGSWSSVVYAGDTLNGAFSVDIPMGYGDVYYYRCFATNAVGVDWANSTTSFVMSHPPMLLQMTVTNGLLYHLKADSLGYADNDSVAQWDDVSGNGRHFVQGTGSYRPTFKANVINGRPAIRFDGGDDQLTYNGATPNETVIIVNKINVAGGMDGIWGSSNPGDKGIRMRDNDEWNGQGGNGDNNDFSWPAGGATYVNGASTVFYGSVGTWHILAMNRGTAHSSVYNVTHLGYYYGGRVFDGDIAEVLVYNRVLSSNELEMVGSYLSGKYGLTTTYPDAGDQMFSFTNNLPAAITTNSATLNAELDANGWVFDLYAYWGTVNGATTITSWLTNMYLGAVTNYSGIINHPVAGLTPNTTYYYNFRITNDFTNIWAGPVGMEFGTLGAPSVTNYAATDVTVSSATLNGELLSGGSADGVFFWGLTNAGASFTGWDHTNIVGSVVQGNLVSESIIPYAGGTYYYRFYATNSFGGAWSVSSGSFSTPQAAVSLKSTMAGASISPTNLGGCCLWLDASDIDGDSNESDNPADGTTIYSWLDRSGSGHHANNSGGTPNYVTNGPNGKPVVHFTAAQQEYLYTTYDFDALSEYTVFAVTRYTGGSNGRILASKTRNWLFGQHGALEDRFHAEGWIYAGNIPASSNWRLYTGTINNAPNPLASFWAEGRLLVADNTGSSDTIYKPGKLGLGGHLQGNSEYSDCEIAEVLIYDRILTSLERVMINTYLGQKYGITIEDSANAILEKDMALNITAVLNTPAASNVTVSVEFPPVAMPGLLHKGYHVSPDALMNLNTNGGLMAMVPYATTVLTYGPGNRGLDFNSDADFVSSGSIGQNDYYMNLFWGYINPMESGFYEFRVYQSDDRGGMWLDLNQNGVFEAPGGFGTGENIEWLYWANYGSAKSYYLYAGQYYMFAATHGEYGGGSVTEVRIKAPSWGSEATIQPMDSNQLGLWTYAPPPTQVIQYTISPLTTNIVIPAGSLSGYITLTPIDDILCEEQEDILTRMVSAENATATAPTYLWLAVMSDDPEVSNDPGATNLTVTSADVYGTLEYGFSADVTVYCGTTDGGTNKGSWDWSFSMGPVAEDVPSYVSVTGLSAGTVYYYRCYAENGSLLGEDWADTTASFTTIGPVASISDRSVIVERDIGTVGFILTVSLTEASGSDLSVDFAAIDGTAVAGSDYLATNGTLTIPAGQLSGNIIVRAVSDEDFDPPPQVFYVLLSNPVGCTLGEKRADITIIDNDAREYLSDWQYKVNVTIPYSGVETLYEWPALIRLSTSITGFSYSTFSTNTGGDLRFAVGDQETVCVYSIDKWNTAGESTVWVQIPIMKPGGTNLWIYWGNPAETEAPLYTQDASTWDSAYQGVWHLQTDAADSTANGYNGTLSVGGATSLTACVVSSGWDFLGGQNDFFVITRPVQDDFSISFWVRPDGGALSGTQWGQGKGLVDGDVSGEADDFGVSYLNVDGKNQPVFGTGNPDITLKSGVEINGAWHHVAATRDRETGEKIIYVDGVYRSAQTGSTNSLTAQSVLRFGKLATPANQFDGKLDEIRISDSVRSGDWIALNYTNQMPGSTFCTYGIAGGRPSIRTVSGATFVSNTSAYATATLSSTGSASTAVWLYWGTNDGGQVESAWASTQTMGSVTVAPSNYNWLVTGLLQGTEYYYAYMASNTFGKQWASTNFYTQGGKPFLNNTAGAVGYIGYATLNGYVLSTGGVPATVYTYWGETDGGTTKTSWDHVITNGIKPVGPFSANTDNSLIYGRYYYYRCYATNSYAGNWANTTETFLSDNPRINDGYLMKVMFTNYHASTLFNVPLVVRFSQDLAGFSYDQFLSNQGHDLRFWDSEFSGELNYQIENWSTNYNFEPTDLTNCVLWLDAWDIDGYGDGSVGDPDDGEFVKIWYDKSSARNNARLTSGSPVVDADGINNGPVVKFTTGQKMKLSSPITAQGSTIFLMFRCDDIVSDWQPALGEASGTRLHVKRNNSGLYGGTERVFDWNGVGLDILSGISAAEWHMQVIQPVAGNNKLWIDDVLFTDASGNTFGPFGDVGNMIADYAEVIIYNRTMSDEERIKVGSYLESKYELKSGYTAQDESYVWIQVPVLSSTNTYIWAGWGDTNATDQPVYATNGAIWAAAGYTGVWHLAETSIVDSAFFNNAVSNFAAMAGGMIGDGQYFNNTFIEIGNEYLYDFYSRLTVSCWMKTDRKFSQNWQAFVTKGGEDGQGWQLRRVSGTDYGHLCLRGTTGADDYSGTVNINDNQWHHLVGVYDTTNRYFYVDGATDFVISDNNVITPTDFPLRFGTQKWLTARHRGWMDEIRISRGIKTPDWILAQYYNQRHGTGFNTYGDAAVVPAIENEPVSNLKDISATLNATLMGAAAEYNVWVYWGETDGEHSPSAWTWNAFVGSYTNVSGGTMSYDVRPGGLQKQKTYYYTFYVVNNAGSSWAAPSESFYTREPMGTIMIIY